MLLPENRSMLMSRIRAKGNRTTELALVGGFREARIPGWRRQMQLPGRPDFTFPRARLCVFVHGCFWHGCRHCYTPPRKNSAFWAAKIASNRTRDRRVARELRARGYRVLTLWECELKGSRRGLAVARVQRALSRAG